MLDSLSGLIFLALLAGAFIPMQTGVNMQLARSVGSPVIAALFSFAVGTISLAIYTFFNGLRLPTGEQLASTSFGQWTGGLLGAFFVTASIFLAPRLGIAPMLALIIGGQMITSIVIDHFGWLGFEQHPVTPWRITGALLLIVGVLLIKAF